MTPTIAGPPGPRGFMGFMGLPGPRGPPASALGFANFYSLNPPDSPVPLPPGADIPFPRVAAMAGGIAPLTATSFNLAVPGVYLVGFIVSNSNSGQLVLTLNGAEYGPSAVGAASDGVLIVGSSILRTVTPNTVLTVRNPASTSTPVAVTPTAGGGGGLPTTSQLTVQRLM